MSINKHVKQVILIRKDLKNTEGHRVRSGKLMAQVAHASMAVLLNQMAKEERFQFASGTADEVTWSLSVADNSPWDLWLNGSFTKVCLTANSEEDLLSSYAQAKGAGLPCSLIQDNGLTEFGGVKTYTTCAIGPFWSDEIDKITGQLSLFT